VNSLRLLPLVVLLALLPGAAPAQQHPASTVPVLLLSDIHLDPFHDPAKLPQLLAAPASAWAAILDAPPSPTQAADFAHLQTTCNARGVDTPPALLRSSLQAAHQQQPQPLFVTVSGDLLAHQFDCRFRTLAPTATAAGYSAFAAKTIAFVALQLHLTFPHSPIYFALGNNDSGCADYREDPNSAFLRADAASFAEDALSPANRAAILSSFPELGDYTLTLPAPIQHTRLIVLQDIFESKRYTACNSSNPPTATTPAATQIAWLRTQLTAARSAHQHVWVMAHIPPGIDAYSTFARRRNVCAGQSPETFLSTDAFATTLADFPDVIRLVLLGHTHMDEFRVYKEAAGANAAAGTTTPDGIIPAKLVPSITPVNGNNPAFTLAAVEPSTATLKDYAVFAASNQTGISTTWAEEYRYSTTYHLPDLSGRSLARLTTAFLADKSSATAASQAYQRFFYVGEPGAGGLSASLKAAVMQIVWPAYACAITEPSAAGFRNCVCPATPIPAP
jgi:sphingomyelin phosphodiesterase acid-like 3